MEAYYTFSEVNDGLIVFLAGCNYKCPYCNTNTLIEFKNECLQDLKLLFNVMKMHSGERIMLSGGEPLLQRQAIINILTKAKKLSMYTVVDTNASKPGVLKDLLKRNLLDEVIVGINASKEEFEAVTRSSTFFKSSDEVYNDFVKSLQILKAYEDSVTITFKSVVVPGLIFKKESFIRIADLIKDIDAEWIIRPFNPENTMSKMYSGVEKPSLNFVAKIKDAVEKVHPNMRITIEEAIALERTDD